MGKVEVYNVSVNTTSRRLNLCMQGWITLSCILYLRDRKAKISKQFFMQIKQLSTSNLNGTLKSAMRHLYANGLFVGPYDAPESSFLGELSEINSLTTASTSVLWFATSLNGN